MVRFIKRNFAWHSLTRLSGLIALSLVTLTTGSYVIAAQPGLYLGGQAGWGYVHDSGISSGDMDHMIGEALDHFNFTTSSFNGTNSDGGFAWRVFGGYQIGYHWAVEAGWSQFENLSVRCISSGYR